MRDNIPSDNEVQDVEEGSDPTQALVPIAERSVDFYGDDLQAVLLDTNGQQQVYVPLRQFCDYLGLNWSGQLQRLRRDRVLKDKLSVCVIHTDKLGARDAICLPLELLPGWLFGVSTSRIKPELETKIDRYRLECFAILWRAFEADTQAVARPEQTTDAIAALEQIRTTALAVAQMAEQQIELERKQAATDQRLDRAAAVVGDIQKRLAVVEKRTAPQQVITDEEAEEVASAVKALAEYLTIQEPRREVVSEHL